MIVTFRKHVEQRVTSWIARRGKRTLVPGTHMALGRGELPHDLEQMIVEGAAGVEFGFWGCIAKGATFNSTGRKRTRPGRAVIAEHKHDIDAAEGLVHQHVQAWREGKPTPAAEPLERLTRAWEALGDGEPLTVEWPTLRILSPEMAITPKR